MEMEMVFISLGIFMEMEMVFISLEILITNGNGIHNPRDIHGNCFRKPRDLHGNGNGFHKPRNLHGNGNAIAVRNNYVVFSLFNLLLFVMGDGPCILEEG